MKKLLNKIAVWFGFVAQPTKALFYYDPDGIKDVMLDLETLGTEPGSVILSIGATFFNANGLGEQMYIVINTQSALEAGLKLDPRTVEWWSKQSAEARSVTALAATSTVSLEQALQMFSNWLEMRTDPKKVRIWGNGSDFDNVMMQFAYKAAGLPYPVKFYNHRCFRTLKNIAPELGSATPERAGVHHDALDDAIFQAECAVRMLNRINGWEN